MVVILVQLRQYVLGTATMLNALSVLLITFKCHYLSVALTKALSITQPHIC